MMWHTKLHPVDLWAPQKSPQFPSCRTHQKKAAWLCQPLWDNFTQTKRTPTHPKVFHRLLVKSFPEKCQLFWWLIGWTRALLLDDDARSFYPFVFSSLSEQQIFTTMSSWGRVQFPTENWASAAAAAWLKVSWDKDENRTWIFWFPLLCPEFQATVLLPPPVGTAFQSWRLSKASSFSKH